MDKFCRYQSHVQNKATCQLISLASSGASANRLAVVLLAVRAQTRPPTSFGLQAEVLEDEFLRSFPHLAGRPVLGRAVTLIEAHTNVPVSERRPVAGGRLRPLRLTLLGRRGHRSSVDRLGDGKDVLLNGEGGPLRLDVVGREERLLNPPIVCICMEDEIHKFSQQSCLVAATS